MPYKYKGKMGQIPILKPREVMRILKNLDFTLFDKGDLIANSDMQMAEAQQCPIIKDETFRPFCFGRLHGISG